MQAQLNLAKEGKTRKIDSFPSWYPWLYFSGMDYELALSALNDCCDGTKSEVVRETTPPWSKFYLHTLFLYM